MITPASTEWGDISRTIDIINGCSNINQLHSAYNYVKLVIKKHQNIHKDVLRNKNKENVDMNIDGFLNSQIIIKYDRIINKSEKCDSGFISLTDGTILGNDDNVTEEERCKIIKSLKKE